MTDSSKNARQDRNAILNASHTHYLQELLTQYRLDPDSVDTKWQAFFDDMIGESSPMDVRHEIVSFPIRQPGAKDKPAAPTPSDDITVKSLRALMMVRAYRVRGHLAATLDPLRIEKPRIHPELDPSRYGFSENEYDTIVNLDGVLGIQNASVRTILDKLKGIYCQNTGFEFMHIQDADQKSWLQERIENGLTALTKRERVESLTHIMRADAFERFLHVKFPGAKRFGLEGGGRALWPPLKPF